MSPHNQPTYYGSGRGRIFWGTISPLVRRGVRWNSLLKLFTAPAQIWGKKLTEKEVCQLNQGALHIAYCNWKWIQSSIGLGQGAVEVELSPISVWWPVGFERCRLEDLRQNTGYRMIKLTETVEYGNKLILCKLTDSGGRLMLGLDWWGAVC